MTMTLIRNGKVIADVNKERNLFTLDLADPRKAIAVIIPPGSIKYRALAMIRQRQPIHLVS